MTTFTREDFEHAARAAGYVGINFNAPFSEALGYPAPGHQRGWWHPVADDGDALRLLSAINLSLAFIPDPDGFGAVMIGDPFVDEEMPRTYERYGSHSEKPVAVRRAIFRAAIEVGKAMLARESAKASADSIERAFSIDAPDLRPKTEFVGISPSAGSAEQQTEHQMKGDAP